MLAHVQRHAIRALPRVATQYARAQAALRALEAQQQAADAAAPKRGKAFKEFTEEDFKRLEKEQEENEEDEDEDQYDLDNDEYDEDENEDENENEDSNDVAAVTRPAPDWTATALMPNGEFQKLSSSDFLGKWTVLFFYPLDFTFVCPTEIRAFSDRFEEFEKLDCNVIAASVDSEYSHYAWTQQSPQSGGLGPMKIPILSDITKNISRSYGVLLEEEGVALRGLFIIDPKGILRQSTINDLPIGRSVDETLRLIQAFQFHAANGEVCPAGWTPGKEAMSPNTAGLKKYFSKKE